MNVCDGLQKVQALQYIEEQGGYGWTKEEK